MTGENLESEQMSLESVDSKVDAVVLAGSINKIALFPGCPPGSKALAQMHGKALIDYVLDALQASPAVREGIVVGRPEVLEHVGRREGVRGVPARGTLIDNAWTGLESGGTDRVLICNPDQPLLTTAMVDDFLERAFRVDGDLVSSWVSREAVDQLEPENEHKFAAFGDGKFAHGNLFLVRRRFPDSKGVRRRLDGLYRARKSPLRFAWALGPKLFSLYLRAQVSGRLPTLEETLKTAGNAFGFHLKGVMSPYAEIALDLDEPEDYAAAARWLSRAATSA
jgi:molybdopterin-guanine dinucleotide biosynthesis protein A